MTARSRGADRARGSHRSPSNERAQGRPDAGCTRGLVCNKKHTSSKPQVQPERPGLPCAMVYGFLRALLGEPGFVATVAHRSSPVSLTPASGCQDHTTSPSAPATFVSRGLYVHRIPLPTSVTIAIRPSDGGGTRQDKHKFLK